MRSASLSATEPTASSSSTMVIWRNSSLVHCNISIICPSATGASEHWHGLDFDPLARPYAGPVTAIHHLATDLRYGSGTP